MLLQWELCCSLLLIPPVIFLKVLYNNKNIIVGSYCVIFLGPASQTHIPRPDAVKQNLINVNYKWKNTTVLSETDTTHNRLEDNREREER